MTGVAVLLVLGGATLVYGAFRGFDPRSLLTSVFTGAPPTQLPPIPGVSSLVPGSTGTGLPMTGGSPPGAGAGNLTAAIQTIIPALQQAFPKVRIGGTYVCRRIAGSTTPSQHAWGNAVDVTGPSTVYMARIAAWAVQQAKSGALPIAQVLWWGKDQLNGGSVAGHRDHVHLTGSPQATGTPPCMGQQK